MSNQTEEQKILCYNTKIEQKATKANNTPYTQTVLYLYPGQAEILVAELSQAQFEGKNVKLDIQTFDAVNSKTGVPFKSTRLFVKEVLPFGANASAGAPTFSKSAQSKTASTIGKMEKNLGNKGVA